VAERRALVDRGVTDHWGGSREAVAATATRRLAAILAADVAGYSRLMGADEEGTLNRLKARRRDLVDPKIREHHGRIVKTTGDGMLVEFSSVVDAVRCAVEIQRAMVDRNAVVPEDKRITFRMGVNLGDVIADGDDIYGDGVNIAARLEALAEPGGVCISRTVRDHIGDRLPYTFEDIGEQSVKNIAQPVHAYALNTAAVASLPEVTLPLLPIGKNQRSSKSRLAVLAACFIAVIAIGGAGWWVWPRGTPSNVSAPSTVASVAQNPPVSQLKSAPRLSIVVLPFANLSNDPEQQYFADGVTENVTTDLSRIAHSFVISRNTAFTYRNKPVDTKEIGRELGVRYVLQGSVQRSGNRVRINAQLIDAETDKHLWTDRFDRDLGDFFALQNEITGRIANALNLELVGMEAARPTDHPEALDYIFRGRAANNKGSSREAYAEAIDQYERALVLEPGSVEAQSLLALTLGNRVLEKKTGSAAADIVRAEGLIERALATSPHDPLAHLAKGVLLRAQNRPEEAMPEFETVLAFNPNSTQALHLLGWCKWQTGSIDEVIPLAEQAIRLNPRDPYIANRYGRIGAVHLEQSRTDEAIVWLEKGRNADPRQQYNHAFLAAAYGLKGELGHAAAELAEAKRLFGDDRFSSIARLRTTENWGVPKIRALVEATYFVGLRRAGVPEE
jgi:TolB-like protein/class 3 adenylate cyclase/Flp pilus assembly protein TadD